MAMTVGSKNGHGSHPGEVPSYEDAILGYRNYWYPVCLSREVTERAKPMRLLGDEVVLMRRNGQAYAVINECPHRGTRLEFGKYEFPGTTTITCRYHGWTFDVSSGVCVGALTDGPDSPVVGKVRVKTYPVEERKGLVWIWMGKRSPVPIEEDIPPVMLHPKTCVHVFRRTAYGNWRWHAENVGTGHAAMLHRDSIHTFFRQMPAYGVGFDPRIETQGEDGEWLIDAAERRVAYADYPGLGRWPRPRPWRRAGSREPALFGVTTKVSLRLPGITRVPHFPIRDSMYYEWYTPIDEDHYIYFQVSCGRHGNPLQSLIWHAKLFLWGIPTGMNRFNSQDMGMVADSRNYEKRHGGNWPSPLFRPDGFQLAWRRMCDEQARGGLGIEPSKHPEIAVVQEEEEREPVAPAP